VYTIHQVIITRPYTIEYHFNDGTVTELDFEKKLQQWTQKNREQLIGQLLYQETFNSTQFDVE
jgi:hypothetical protein